MQRNWKKILLNVAWGLLGLGTIVLLGAAMQKKSHKTCSEVRIEITGAEKHMFIDEQDVLDILHAAGAKEGMPVNSINLRALETVVEKNPWVQNAEMFVNNNQVLEISIRERQPVARVFTRDGYSFYVDSSALRLPLSEKLSARVPVFTGFPTGNPVLAKPDSLLLYDVVKMGQYILADSFWMAQVAQMDITPEARFEMIPVIGDHVVAFGTAADMDSKFCRLYTFYRKDWLRNGINTYERLDLQYASQVVAVRKGTAKAQVDSAKAKEIMDALVKNPQVIPDSSTVTKSAAPVARTAKDSAVVTNKKTVPVQSQSALPAKPKTITTNNNKSNKKALTNKAKPATAKKQQPVSKRQPKAVLGKARSK